MFLKLDAGVGLTRCGLSHSKGGLRKNAQKPLDYVPTCTEMPVHLSKSFHIVSDAACPMTPDDDRRVVTCTQVIMNTQRTRSSPKRPWSEYIRVNVPAGDSKGGVNPVDALGTKIIPANSVVLGPYPRVRGLELRT